MTDDEVRGEKEVRVERISHFAERTISILGVGMVTLAVALFFLTWYLQNTDDVFAPLGPYPEQIVEHEFELDGLPAFRLGDPIPVHGEKCSDVAVEVIGTVQWQTVDPAGTFIPIGTGHRAQPVGCQSYDFVNEMPPEVLEVSENLYDEGHIDPVWVVTGIETPIDPENGENGESITWTTEPFVIVPSDFNFEPPG